MTFRGKLAALILCLATLSCTRGSKTDGAKADASKGDAAPPIAVPAAPAPAAPTAPTAPTTTGDAATTPKDSDATTPAKTPDTAPKAQTPAKPAPKLPPKYRAGDALALYAPNARLLPDDYTLGPLAASTEARAAQAEKTARDFMDGVVQRTAKRDLIAPEARAAVAELIAASLKAAPDLTGYRLGAAVRTGDDTFTANVRVTSALGRAEGELLLERSQGQTYVAAFLVDLGTLLEPYEPEPFVPERYGDFYP